MDNVLHIDRQNILDTIHSFLSGEDFFENKKIEISDDLKKLIIQYKGEAYKSSISTGVMRSFIRLQASINDIFSIYAYGENKKIPTEILERLEINVLVSDGSSRYHINIEKISEAISDRIRRMTGKELAGIIAALCATFLLSTLSLRAIDHRAEIERMRQTNAMVTDIQRNTAEAMIAAMQSQQSFYRITSRQGFDTLEIDGQPFTHKELKEIVRTERPRHPVESKVFSGKFRITDIHFGDDGNFIDVVSASEEYAVKNVNMLIEIMGTDNYQWFKDSASGNEVEMTIVATVKNGEIIASYLQSFSLPLDAEE